MEKTGSDRVEPHLLATGKGTLSLLQLVDQMEEEEIDPEQLSQELHLMYNTIYQLEHD